jgi:exonuclease SbcC
MRPVRIDIAGFGAFRQPASVDLDDTDFFALVGPTGAGKSTIIDAICFALYGSVPRYDDQRLVASALSAGHNEARVQLTFELAGSRYAAARVVRRGRDGRATTKEARLERLTPAPAVLAGRANEMATAVEELLGLSFEHFTRCVVLPQGEFARFLHDKPSDRQALLVRLLDLGIYDDMAREANRRAAVADGAVAFATRRLDELVEATPDAVAQAVALVECLEGLVDQMHAAAPAVQACDAAMVEAQRRVVTGADAVAALEAVAVPAGFRTLAADAASAAVAVADADRDHTAAEGALAVARTEREQAGLAAPLEQALAAHADLAAAEPAARKAAEQRVEAEAAALRADEAVAAAADAVTTADAAVERARQRFAAALLSEHLELHEPCPVCGQLVHEPPAAPPPAEVGESRAAKEQADERLAHGRTHQRVAGERRASAVTSAEAAERRVAELRRRVAEHPDPVAVTERLGALAAADDAVRAAEAAERAARAAVRTAAQRRAAAEQSLTDGRALYHRQRDPLAALGAPPPGDDLLGAWDELDAWAQSALVAQRTAIDAARRDAEQAGRRRAVLLDELTGAAAAAGVRAAPSLDALVQAALRGQAQAEERRRTLEQNVALVGELQIQRDGERERGQVARQLGQLLASNRFERWLVSEALERLVDGASSTLLSLSGGQYSLTLAEGGAEFLVVDHGDGDERRSVRTLSGGETFQASLALALALADQLAALAAGGAAKLDAIFLDEGFGTLDVDALETVAGTIESLGSSGRMVGIVTHVRELAARVPVRYEVRKGAMTSTVERVVT